jgi:23S rRNA (cytosine1962-C5)-methyltransferase
MNIKLNLSGAKKAASGHPHVTVKDLEHFKQLPPAGELVRLQDAMGNFLAHAVSDGPRSAIPYRILSRERHPEFNAQFFEAAVEAALRRRQALMQEDTGLRLLHGEADALPGVFCDRHAGALLIEIQSPGLQVFSEAIQGALWKQGRATSLWVKGPGGWECRKGEKGELKRVSRVAGLKFQLRLEEEVPADFDLEQRMNYARLSDFAPKGGALIAFSRKGAWAAAALRAGAESALCLERDGAANLRAAENLKLNGYDGRAEFLDGDAMQRLEALAKQGRRFALIMADTPRSSAGTRLKFQAAKHGAGLAARLLTLLAPGGIAAFSLAASELSAQGFQNALQRGSEEAKIETEVAAAGRFAPDFPELAGFEQPSSRRFLALKHKALA